MNWNLLPEATLVLTISAMSFGIAIFGWCRSSSNRVASCFAIFMVGICISSFSYAMQLASTTLTSCLFWFHLEFLGTVLIAPGLLTFTVLYTNREKWMTVKFAFILGTISLLILLLVYTNDYHHLVYSNPRIININQTAYLFFDFGAVLWINFLYLMALNIISVVLITLHVSRASGVFLGQSVCLIMGILAPTAAYFLLLANANPIEPLGLVTFTYLVTDICFSLAIFKFGFLKFIPVTRDVLIENIPDCVIVLDRNECVIDLNPAAQRVLGIKSRRIIGKPVSQVMEQFDYQISRMNNKRILSLNTGNEKREFELNVSPLNDWQKDSSGSHLYILHDITDRNVSEKALEESEAFHRSVVELAYDGIGIVDEKNILFANQCLCGILGVQENEILGKPLTDYIPRKVMRSLTGHIQKQMNGTEPKQIHESLLLHSSGKEIPVEIITNRIQGRRQDDNRVLVIVRDITERKRSEARLQRLATIDDLTGCFNRRHFFSLANKEFERTCRYNLEMSIILLDIDHFKNINDTYGHIVGDRALQKIAQQCLNNLREWDMLARYGGEEFIILLPDTSIKSARQTAERLRSVVENTIIHTAKQSISVTISLGVSGYTQEDNLSLEQLLDRADQALYLAKENGRNRVQVWSPACTIKL